MKNRSMDLLKYQAFPDLAAAVRARMSVIMSRWMEQVRKTLPAANEMTLAQVRNRLPETLELLASALESDEPKATKDLMDQAVAHGETRFDQNFALNELMIEFSLLRPIVIEEAAAHLDHAITVEESVALNMGIDVAERRGVTFYVNEQKAELQALVEAQTKYLSFLSHDLRGGLNGVLLMMEVLRRELRHEPKFATSLDDLETMRRAILDTVATMDRFLHAERFRKGKVQVHPARIDFAALVADVVGQFSYQAKDKGLELESSAEDGIEVISDRDLLATVLQNLMGNAIKYSRQGKVTLTAKRISPKAGGGRGAGAGEAVGARVSVTDQGPGIAPEKLSGMFQSFTRGETHGQSGSGLGLSIAQQAATLLGAKLWAESKLGEGTAFHLDLPQEPSAAGGA